MVSDDGLTVLTSWAEAIAEALALAPASIEALAGDSQSDASWRNDRGICEPSPPLGDAINGICQIARAAGAADGKTPLDTALLAANDSQPSESGLEGLAYAVLRQALRQRRRQGCVDSSAAVSARAGVARTAGSRGQGRVARATEPGSR
jgi:hypothetical protein